MAVFGIVINTTSSFEPLLNPHHIRHAGLLRLHWLFIRVAVRQYYIACVHGVMNSGEWDWQGRICWTKPEEKSYFLFLYILNTLPTGSNKKYLPSTRTNNFHIRTHNILHWTRSSPSSTESDKLQLHEEKKKTSRWNPSPPSSRSQHLSLLLMPK